MADMKDMKDIDREALMELKNKANVEGLLKMHPPETKGIEKEVTYKEPESYFSPGMRKAAEEWEKNHRKEKPAGLEE